MQSPARSSPALQLHGADHARQRRTCELSVHLFVAENIRMAAACQLVKRVLNETKRNETKLRSFIFHRHRWAWQNCNRVVTRWFVKRPTLRRDARFALLGKWIGPLGKFILM